MERERDEEEDRREIKHRDTGREGETGVEKIETEKDK